MFFIPAQCSATTGNCFIAAFQVQERRSAAREVNL